jgi:tellurite resistance protein
VASLGRKKNGSGGALLFVIIISWILIANFGVGMAIALGIIGLCYVIFKHQKPKNKTSANTGRVKGKPDYQNGGVYMSFSVGQPTREATKDNSVFYETETLIRIGKIELPIYLSFVGKGNLPHIIDPTLPFSVPDATLKANMGYWPAYQAITMDDRATYLQWYAGGRKDPQADIGLVFMYFYGLEYRAIEYGKNHLAIYHEVVRLFKIYAPANASFARYCSGFIQWLLLTNPTWNSSERSELENFLRNSREFANLFKAIMVMIAKDVSQLDFIKLVAYVHLGFKLPNSLNDQESEILGLFDQRILKDNFDIPKLKPVRDTFPYRPASSAVADLTVDTQRYNFPHKLVNQLEDIWSDTLVPYLEFAKLKKTNSKFAHIFAPSSMGSDEINKSISSFLNFPKYKQCKISSLLEAMGASPSEAFNCAEARGLAQMLQRHNVSIEPDARITSKGLKKDEEIILIKGDLSLIDIDRWRKAVNLLDLSMSIALAENSAEELEVKHTLDFIIKQFKLTKIEIDRITHRSILLKKTKPSTATLAKKLSTTVSAKQAGTLAKFLFSIAAVDGKIAASEIKALEKSYKALNLPPDTLDKMIQQFTVSNRGDLVKIEVEQAPSKKQGSKIPRIKDSAGPVKAEIVLNQDALKEAFAEAEEVSRILSTVFAEEKDSSIESELKHSFESADHPSITVHLTATEREVLKILSSKERWDIDEADKICRKAGIMYGSFLTKINDYYENKDGSTPLDEDGDELLISLAITSEGQHSA